MEKLELRARDFWTSLVLIAVSAFFLWQTSAIPFFKADAAGVDSGQWYNSAALVPYFIFSALLLCGFGLLLVALRDGGGAEARRQFTRRIDWSEWSRVGCVAVMLLSYIAGLVPRVDFILSSALLITGLIWGFHGNGRWLAAIFLAVPATYAFVLHFPQSDWATPHDDDWVALGAFVLMTATMFWHQRRAGHLGLVTKLTPLLALLVPALLVAAMAFGFRQNVPNRTGLVFSQMEYHYYVTLRPLWQDR